VPDPWTAEVSVDADLARRLVETQFPELVGASVEPLGAGWDNTAYVVGGEWVFRFPRRTIALPLNARELALLPAVAPRVPLPVPRPEKIGRADGRFPWPFAGYRLLPGRTACAADLDDARRATAAAPLGRFLAALHAFPVGEAVDRGARPDHCGKLDVPHRGPRTRKELAELKASPAFADLDLAALERALDVTMRGDFRPVFLHGDMYSRHLLVDDAGAVAGVIDWGDCHVGDPATDLALAHLFLPPQAHGAFRAAYGSIDDVTWRLARFRAVTHATACARFSLSTNDAGLLRETQRSLRWTAQ
jgi:aminoglycoside phosphotransferase (APT) family kinase protein